MDHHKEQLERTESQQLGQVSHDLSDLRLIFYYTPDWTFSLGATDDWE